MWLIYTYRHSIQSGITWPYSPCNPLPLALWSLSVSHLWRLQHKCMLLGVHIPFSKNSLVRGMAIIFVRNSHSINGSGFTYICDALWILKYMH
eukprot:942424_1